MNAKMILNAARQAGVELEARGDHLSLRYRPGALTDELRDGLLAEKAAIVALLQIAPDPDACSVCGRTNWTVSLVLDDGRRLCRRCLGGA